MTFDVVVPGRPSCDLIFSSLAEWPALGREVYAAGFSIAACAEGIGEQQAPAAPDVVFMDSAQGRGFEPHVWIDVSQLRGDQRGCGYAKAFARCGTWPKPDGGTRKLVRLLEA